MTTVSLSSKKPFVLPFFNVRNISSPDDLDNGRRVYIGHADVAAITELPTDENVRDYMLEAEGKKRRRPTQVHKAIQETLENNPQNFSVLNSGVAIVARDCEIDEKAKVLKLRNPSVINGSQTQGVIRDFFEKAKNDVRDLKDFHAYIKFELIVTDNDDLIAEISISRNFQNDVMTISIAGRLGQLDELEQSFQSKFPKFELQKSETKLSEDYVKTERLLQVITALIPEELWLKSDFNKVYTYSMKAKCLKDFQEYFRRARDAQDSEQGKYREIYQFYLDIAAEAYALYEKWKRHQGFAGTGLRAIQREGNEIKEVPDGIVFPILASLSAFAVKETTGWTIKPPAAFQELGLIQAAKTAYMEIAHHNPWNMGKSRACYSLLYQITSIYKKA